MGAAGDLGGDTRNAPWAAKREEPGAGVNPFLLVLERNSGWREGVGNGKG